LLKVNAAAGLWPRLWFEAESSSIHQAWPEVSTFVYNFLYMKLLNQPLKILLICLTFATVSLLFNGTFLQLYRLHRDRDVLHEQIRSTKMQIIDLDQQLKMAKDPVFIERQALDNYDLADENDLVFVFSEE
jgi:hypothetical protein